MRLPYQRPDPRASFRLAVQEIQASEDPLAVAALMCIQVACEARGYKATIRKLPTQLYHAAKATLALDVEIGRYLFVITVNVDMIWMTMAQLEKIGLQDCIVPLGFQQTQLPLCEPDFEDRLICAALLAIERHNVA